MLKQALYQKQQQRLSPLQIQLVRLLELPVQEFSRRVQEELDENPALDEGSEEDLADLASEPVNVDLATIEDFPDSHAVGSGHASFDSLQGLISADSIDLQSAMLQQLQMRNNTPKEQTLGTFLIGYMDDEGYIRRPLVAIADDLAFTYGMEVNEKDLESVIRIIQGFEPAGVGARNLKECLHLQLQARAKDGESVTVARALLDDHFEDFINRRYDKIKEQLGITDRELQQAEARVVRLNPKPGNNFGEQNRASAGVIFPDFIVEYRDGELQQRLASRNTPSLRVAKEYRKMLQNYSAKRSQAERDALLFARHKVEAASWFIDAVKQRQLTLNAVMSAIVKHQREVFTTGDFDLIRPLLLKNVSEDVGYDLSTVSRVVNSKYVQTNFGVYSLRDFFSDRMQTSSGEEVSTRRVRQVLLECISAESKAAPLSDLELQKALKRAGYTIARRTVAKYREQLAIPIARRRKENYASLVAKEQQNDEKSGSGQG